MKILVVSHGDLSKSLVKTAEMISGKNNKVSYIGLYPQDNPDDLSEKIEDILRKDNEIKIIMVDLLGGSPMIASVKAIKILGRKDISLFSGVNLALLLEASHIISVQGEETINNSELLKLSKESIELVLEGEL